MAGLFDSYAEKFDQHLVQGLGYSTPQLLADEIRLALTTSKGGPAPQLHRCVDLGCGTGLPLCSPPNFRRIRTPQGSTPTPWARGLRDQIQKRALHCRFRHRKSFMHRVHSARRVIEAMVSGHGLRPWSRKGPDHGVGVDPSLLRIQNPSPHYIIIR